MNENTLDEDTAKWVADMAEIYGPEDTKTAVEIALLARELDADWEDIAEEVAAVI